ncbi:MAG: DNA internalization-related competence protein ComEC/Rec2 [Planctomycetaceae bacterium]|nr:DNA internalization-related competence protein ComEC/Rec2 [Planctomycetaceae bacterium]
MVTAAEKKIEGPAVAKPSAPRILPLVMVFLAVATGICSDRYLGFSILYWWTGSLCSWCLWWVFIRGHRNQLAAISLLTSVAALAGAWHHWQWYLFADNNLGFTAHEAPQPVCFEGVALNGPRTIPPGTANPLRTIVRGEETRLSVQIIKVRNGADWQSSSGKTHLFVEGQLLGVHPGDRIRVFARMLKPRPAQNPGEFDLWLHQRADRILCRNYANYPDCVTVLDPRVQWSFRGWIESVRSRCNEILWSRLSHQRSGLATAVLLGAREQLNREKIEDFVVTGTIHLFAISGLHVGILATALFFLARLNFVSQRWAPLFVFCLVLLYAMLTDARPPVVRATVLLAALCGGMLMGRKTSPFNSLAAAAIFILAINPSDLFRTGTQLSFLAVATLYWFSPCLTRVQNADPLAQLVEKSRPRFVRWLRRIGKTYFQLALASGVIWLVALPLVMHRFHILSLSAVLLNTILWIPMLVALLSGFSLLLLTWLAPPAAPVAAWICDNSLWVLEMTVATVRSIPASHFWVTGPTWWWLAVFYAGVFLLASVPLLRPTKRWCLTILAIWIGIGFLTSSWERWQRTSNQTLACTFLSVGHGTSVVLEIPGGKTVLYDAGTSGSPSAATRSVSSFLWSRGITHLDAIILSHADVDHYNGLPELMDRLSVGSFFISPVTFAHMNPALEQLLQSLEKNGIHPQKIDAGDLVHISHETRIEVLHPPAMGSSGSDNSNSIVLEITYQGRRILLPGDLETPGLEAVIAKTPRRYDLVMAPHHGSLHSSPHAFAAWSQPDWMVVSSGYRHDVQVVAGVYKEVGAQVLETAKSGAIRFLLDSHSVRVLRWREEAW